MKILHHSKIKTLCCISVVSIVLYAQYCAYSYNTILRSANVQVYFSPHGGAQEALVAAINQAQESIYVQAYSFTSAPIAKSLVDAARRGVKVVVILDKSQRSERYTGATFLRNEGIPVYIDDKHAIAHNKVMVIDGDEVVTGSFNFTKAAEEKNAENLLIIKDAGLAKLYMENWQNHREHSEGY